MRGRREEGGETEIEESSEGERHMGRCPHEKFTRNNQRSFIPFGLEAPRLVAQATGRRWEESPRSGAIWL